MSIFKYYDPSNYNSTEELIDELVEEEFNGTSIRTSKRCDDSNSSIVLGYTVVRPDIRPDLKLEVMYGQKPNGEFRIYISIEGNFNNRYFDLEPRWLEIINTIKKEKLLWNGMN